MEIKNSYYKEHLKELCKDVHSNTLKEIVSELSSNARFYMNSELEADEMIKVNDTVVGLVKEKFSWLPLHLVGEAYVKGSLGELGGTSRLTVRNIYTWLNAMQEKNQTIIAQRKSEEDSRRRISEERMYKQNQSKNVRFGTALSIKLSWVYENKISADDWEHYTLDSIVAKLEQGFTEKSLKPSQIWSA